MSFRSKYFQLVELLIPATVTAANQDTFFQQQPQLQTIIGAGTVYVKGIECYNINQIIKSPISNSTVANQADLSNGMLTFRVKGSDLIKQVPLSRLDPVMFGNNGNFNLWLFRNLFQIDWTNSRVTTLIAPGGSGTTAPPFAYVFGVHYDYEPDAIDMNPVVMNVYTQPVKI